MSSHRHRPKLIKRLAKLGLALLVLNEIRGAVLAVPVFIGLYQAGGTWMAVWLAFCSLAGIALSVVVPLFIARRISAKFPSDQAMRQTPVR